MSDMVQNLPLNTSNHFWDSCRGAFDNANQVSTLPQIPSRVYALLSPLSSTGIVHFMGNSCLAVLLFLCSRLSTSPLLSSIVQVHPFHTSRDERSQAFHSFFACLSGLFHHFSTESGDFESTRAAELSQKSLPPVYNIGSLSLYRWRRVEPDQH